MRKIAPLKHRRYNFGVEVIPWVLSAHHAKHHENVLSSGKKSHGSTVEYVKELPLVGPFNRKQGADILTKELHIAGEIVPHGTRLKEY
jgi:hypothetical protein